MCRARPCSCGGRWGQVVVALGLETPQFQIQGSAFLLSTLGMHFLINTLSQASKGKAELLWAMASQPCTVNIWILCRRGCSVHCRIFSSISGLYPLDASSSTPLMGQPKIPPDTTKFLWKAKSPPVANRSFRQITTQMGSIHLVPPASQELPDQASSQPPAPQYIPGASSGHSQQPPSSSRALMPWEVRLPMP